MDKSLERKKERVNERGFSNQERRDEEIVEGKKEKGWNAKERRRNDNEGRKKKGVGRKKSERSKNR